MNKYIKTRIEYNSYNTNQTLVLDNPAEVIFINAGATGDRVVINNNLILSSTLATNNGTAQFPSRLEVKMNSNEVDSTNYVIRFVGTADPRLYVIVKYYVM